MPSSSRPWGATMPEHHTLTITRRTSDVITNSHLARLADEGWKIVGAQMGHQPDPNSPHISLPAFSIRFTREVDDNA